MGMAFSLEMTPGGNSGFSKCWARRKHSKTTSKICNCSRCKRKVRKFLLSINTNKQQELRTITTDGITTTCELCVCVSVRSRWTSLSPRSQGSRSWSTFRPGPWPPPLPSCAFPVCYRRQPANNVFARNWPYTVTFQLRESETLRYLVRGFCVHANWTLPTLRTKWIS